MVRLTDLSFQILTLSEYIPEVIMIRYIPIKEVHGEFINLNVAKSFNWARVIMIIGGRGYGKTYSVKRQLVKDQIYNNKNFLIIRDSIDACSKICEEGGYKLFGDVFTNEKNLSRHTYNIKNSTIFIDDKISGAVMPISDYYKYKGNYYNIDNILFDEFIPEDIQVYRGNRARQFAHTIETVVRRNPKTRVYMTANALDLGNDILELFGFNIKNGEFGYYLNKEKVAVLYYAPNSPEFEDAKKNSLSGKITKGTFLDANMNQNKFENDTCSIFEKREACGLVGIYYNLEDECFRLYKHISKNLYYVCKDVNSNTNNYMRFVFTPKQIGIGRKFADSKVRDWLKQILANNQVLFQSKYLFGIYCSIVNSTKKK